ncbi:MAG TPA: hypothetical protein VNK43_12340, partial [Gemmatimonadales bacterium]|nr:hypothetical protein [Gemmatimonadales bacterium]
MAKRILTALALVAAAACGGGDRAREDTALADSLERDLELAPGDTGAALDDRPIERTEAARPGREPATPR